MTYRLNANSKNFQKNLIKKISKRSVFSDKDYSVAKKIVSDVKKNGDNAVLKYEKKFNKNKVLSICKFEFIDQARSKNINQYLSKKNISLLAIDTIKTKNGFEFNLLFSNNGFITLSSEIIEVILEDLKEIKNDL